MATDHTDDAPDAEAQRRGLLDAQRAANQDQPRNFKDDALTDKVVRVEPDGTGPSTTGTFDPAQDQHEGSGNETGNESAPAVPPAKDANTGQPGAAKVSQR